MLQVTIIKVVTYTQDTAYSSLNRPKPAGLFFAFHLITKSTLNKEVHIQTVISI